MTIRVSIIEDDPSVGQLIAAWINRARGFRLVSHHASAKKALRKLPGEKPDVALVDLDLQDLDGIDCVSRLKPSMPETQFVMLTPREDAERIFNALAAGATGYLLKQTDRAELIAQVRDVFEGGSPISSHVARRVISSVQRPTSHIRLLSRLSNRERQVLELMARGYSYSEIAQALRLSRTTVTTFIRRTCRKLQVNSRAKAVAMYANPPA